MKDIYYKLSQQLLMQDIETMCVIACLESDEKSIFMMGISPYLTALADGAIEFMEQSGINCNDLQLVKIYEPVMKKTRSKIKFYKERIGKNLNLINDIREEEDDKYANLMRFPILRKIGLHYDFGTYSYKGKYIGNTYLYKWFFSEIESIDKTNPHFEFSYALGECISFTKQQWQYQYNVEGSFNFSGIINRDFNITAFPYRLFSQNVNKCYGLFLFNLLCQINFILYYLKEIFNSHNSLYLRVKYIVYYYSCSSVKTLTRYLEQNPLRTKRIDCSKIETACGLVNEDFCNCMRHYTVFSSDCCLPIEDISISPIVMHYFGLCLNEYIAMLDGFLEIISNEIEVKILSEYSKKSI